jgi:transposase
MDVHCKECVFVAQDEEGRKVLEGRIETTGEGFDELRSRYRLEEGTKVAIETGTVAFYAARHLARLGFEPIVVDAHEVRLKATRPNQKSDRRDAIELCEGLRRGIYRSIIHVPDATTQRLRETLSRRRHFVRLKTREINAVKYMLRAEGLAHLAKTLKTEAAWDALHDRLSFARDQQAHLTCHRAVWSCAQVQIMRLEAELDRLAERYAEPCRRLQAIPGFGPIVSLTLVATLSDVSRFPSAKHVASYVGLVPSTYQTGDRECQGRITKRGSPELRSMLCEAAHHAAKPRHPLNPFFARVCAKHGYRKATIAVAHRLLRISYAMLRKGIDFDVGKLGVEAGPFEVKSTRWYRMKDASARSKAPVTRPRSGLPGRREARAAGAIPEA